MVFTTMSTACLHSCRESKGWTPRLKALSELSGDGDCYLGLWRLSIDQPLFRGRPHDDRHQRAAAVSTQVCGQAALWR